MKNLFLIALIAFTLNSISQNPPCTSTHWDDWFMPGAGFKSYIPKNSDFGVYSGFTTEFVIYARAKNVCSKYSGPARTKFYSSLSIMTSSNSESKDIFFSNVGVNLSFEGNLDRKFLIPYFGMEIGGLYQRDFNSFHFTPLTGIQLISTKRVIWSTQVGYQYTTKLFDEYSGFTMGSTLNLLLWEK